MNHSFEVNHRRPFTRGEDVCRKCNKSREYITAFNRPCAGEVDYQFILDRIQKDIEEQRPLLDAQALTLGKFVLAYQNLHILSDSLPYRTAVAAANKIARKIKDLETLSDTLKEYAKEI